MSKNYSYWLENYSKKDYGYLRKLSTKELCKMYVDITSKWVRTNEEKEILAEELGHYYCNALYYINSDKETRNKCEYRAIKWAYSVLIPFPKLKEKIMEGLNLYELADYFNVDVQYMKNCLMFYTEKYGVLI